MKNDDFGFEEKYKILNDYHFLRFLVLAITP